MTPKERVQCLICINTYSGVAPPFQKEILGAVRCSKLEKELLQFFIIRKLLDIPSSWCEEALTRTCEDGEWFRICSGCMDMITDAWCIYQTLLNLEEKMKSVKARIKGVIRRSEGLKFKERSCGEIFNEIRLMVCRDQDHGVVPKVEDATSDLDSYADNIESSMTLEPDFDCNSPIQPDPLFADDQDFMDIKSKPSRKRARDRCNKSRGGIKRKKTNSKKTKSRKTRNGKGSEGSHPHREVLTCNLCPSQFNSQAEIDTHLEAHEESKQNGGRFSCETCSFPARDEVDLKHHKIAKHGNTLKLFPVMYSCKKCDFTTDNHKLLKSHVEEKHSDLSKEELAEALMPTCSTCNKSYISFAALMAHQRKSHPEMFGVEVERIPCDQCEMIFSSRLHLQYHINSAHLRVSKCICDTCGKGFTDIRGLKRHEITHHDGKKEHVCDVCGLDYSHRAMLEDHRRKFHPDSLSVKVDGTAATNANEVVHKCKYCELTSPFRPVIKRHMQSHKLKMGVQCDICEKYYTNERGLKLHKEINHSETKSVYKCEHCFKPFIALHYVKDHMRRFCKIKRLADSKTVISG